MAQTERDPRTNPQHGDLCRDEAGVVWRVTETSDNLVYVETDDGADGLYATCWLREDWAALPSLPTVSA